MLLYKKLLLMTFGTTYIIHICPTLVYIYTLHFYMESFIMVITL